MAIDLYQDGILIGSVVRCTGGCYVYTPEGTPLGQMANLDAAALALAERLKGQAAA
ncbi:hypothetical protein ACFQE0_27355 [Methylobacterium komagatae]|uniref:Uncharacterized protein n=1 Tax=Methylobacterium komagatae TaxID=374425 RepID=A0ABW2BSJ8_9HYPH